MSVVKYAANQLVSGRGYETASEVAKWLWQHSPALIQGARQLWSYLPTGGSSSSPKGGGGGGQKKGKGRLVLSQAVTQSKVNSQPVAWSNAEHNSTYWAESSIGRHPEFGSGIRVVGRQYLADVTTTATDSQLFANGATIGINVIGISPDSLGARLALLGRCYNVYVFRHIRVYYMTRVATTQAGGMVMAYVQDGAYTSYATVDYSSAQQIEGCEKSPFRENVCLEANYFGENCWYTELEVGTTPGQRQTRQGLLVGYPDAGSIGATKMGDLMIEYSCDLYGPVADLGFTVMDRFGNATRRMAFAYIKKIAEQHGVNWAQLDSRELEKDFRALIKYLEEELETPTVATTAGKFAVVPRK